MTLERAKGFEVAMLRSQALPNLKMQNCSVTGEKHDRL